VYGVILVPLLMSWVVSVLAETNRTPFDFAEGESELVSGFNIEYGRGGFAILFLGEYARIIFISYLIVVMFLGGLTSVYMVGGLGVFLCFVFVWVRGTYPRLRYDRLIVLAWKRFLSLSIRMGAFFYCIGVWSLSVV